MDWEFIVVLFIVSAIALLIVVRIFKNIRRISSAKTDDPMICSEACSSCANNFKTDQIHCEKKP